MAGTWTETTPSLGSPHFGQARLMFLDGEDEDAGGCFLVDEVSLVAN